MSSFGSRLAAILGLSTIDEALSADVARNAQGRASLAECEHLARQENYKSKKKVEFEERRVKEKQEVFQKDIQPLIDEFDSIGSSEHSYESITHLMESHMFTAETMSKREIDHYGFIGKKMISVGMHFEALRSKIMEGKPFEKELHATLADAENDDFHVVAAPLFMFAAGGVPSDAAARAEAFVLSQTIEDTWKAVEHKPLKRWIDLFRFQASLSPASIQENRIQAHQNAKDFMRFTKEKEYVKALELVEQHREILELKKDPLLKEFKANEKAFRDVVNPIVATKMFLLYANAELSSERFASVELVLPSASTST